MSNLFPIQWSNYKCIIASLQLGAGTSLPGLVAAKVGADVTLTDEANRLEVLIAYHLVISYFVGVCV